MLKDCLTIGSLAALISLSAAAHSQALPTAVAKGEIQAGVGWSYVQPDYGQKSIQGITAFADYDFMRHIGVEAEYHYIALITPTDLAEESVLFGPRFILPKGRFNFYGKAMIGIGEFSIQEIQDNPEGGAGRYLAYGVGGGADYRVTNHIVARGEFEYQHWSYATGLTPTTTTVAVAYRFH